MGRLRFSIAGLMAVVLVCGVGTAALRYATELWAGILLTLALALLGFALLGASFRRGRARAFWTGFALFGWGYLIASSAPWFDREVGPKLATTAMLDALRPRIGPPQMNGNVVLWTTNSTTILDASNIVTETVTPNGSNVVHETVARQGGPVNWALGGVNANSAQPVRLWTTVSGSGAPEPFRRVGHILLALLAALIGGLVSRAAFGPREDSGDRPAPAASGTEASRP